MTHDDFALSYAFIMLLLERYVGFFYGMSMYKCIRNAEALAIALCGE